MKRARFARMGCAPCILIPTLLAIGCSAPAMEPGPSEYELRKHYFSEAQTFNLEVEGSPWSTFDGIASEMIRGFGYIPASAGMADINIEITLSGEPFRQSFNTHASDRTGRMHNRHDNVELDVGYGVEGKLKIRYHTDAPEIYDLHSSEYGPGSLRPGTSQRILEESKRQVLRELVGVLCERLLTAFPDRVPVELIEQGSGEIEQQACLERMTFDRSRNLKRVIEALLLLDSKPALMARAIGAIRQQDQYDFHSRFPGWLSAGEAEVQTAAAMKLVELNTHVSRNGTEERMFKKEGLHYLDRVNWLLDVINEVNGETRRAIARTMSRSVLPEIQANTPGSAEWHRWCKLKQRIDDSHAALINDADPAVREPVSARTTVVATACTLNELP